MTVETRPGGGVFEATFQVDEKMEGNIKKDFDAEVKGLRAEGSISRLNMYGDTSWCINDSTLRLYCYCRKQRSTRKP